MIHAVSTAGGRSASFDVREDTNDSALVSAVVGQDEYGLGTLPELTGWALDIGSHVGSVAVALAMDHPRVNVIAVEPVPDNSALIRLNAERNGVGDRVHVEEAAATTKARSTVHYGYTETPETPDDAFVVANRYIGNIWHRDSSRSETKTVPGVSIRALAEKYETPSFEFAKIDCEGCEWSFLSRDAKLIEVIVGEWHDLPVDEIRKLLGKTHDVEILVDHIGIGLFRAVRR